jgi:hypothetical protein
LPADASAFLGVWTSVVRCEQLIVSLQSEPVHRMTDLTCHSTLWDTEKSSDLWNTPELIIADGASTCFVVTSGRDLADCGRRCRCRSPLAELRGLQYPSEVGRVRVIWSSPLRPQSWRQEQSSAELVARGMAASNLRISRRALKVFLAHVCHPKEVRHCRQAWPCQSSNHEPLSLPAKALISMKSVECQ